MKKYIYAIPSLIMAMYVSFMIVYLLSGLNISQKNVLFITVIAVIPFIIYVYQIFRCVKDALRDKKYIWIPLVIFLGFIFIPYYGVKYEQDRILLRSSVITYAVAFIFLSSLTVLYAVTLIGKYDYLLLKTKDNQFEIKFSKDWKEKNTDYSVYASNEDKDLAYGVLVFDLTDIEGYTVDNILEDQKLYLDKQLGISLELYKEKTEEELSDKKITTIEYIANLEDGNKIYKLSAMSFNDTNYVVYTFAALFENDYSKYNQEIVDINKSVKKR
jgi:hypothetical protein